MKRGPSPEDTGSRWRVLWEVPCGTRAARKTGKGADGTIDMPTASITHGHTVVKKPPRGGETVHLVAEPRTKLSSEMARPASRKIQVGRNRKTLPATCSSRSSGSG